MSGAKQSLLDAATRAVAKKTTETGEVNAVQALLLAELQIFDLPETEDAAGASGGKLRVYTWPTAAIAGDDLCLVTGRGVRGRVAWRRDLVAESADHGGGGGELEEAESGIPEFEIPASAAPGAALYSGSRARMNPPKGPQPGDLASPDQYASIDGDWWATLKMKVTGDASGWSHGKSASAVRAYLAGFGLTKAVGVIVTAHDTYSMVQHDVDVKWLPANSAKMDEAGISSPKHVEHDGYFKTSLSTYKSKGDTSDAMTDYYDTGGFWIPECCAGFASAVIAATAAANGDALTSEGAAVLADSRAKVIAGKGPKAPKGAKPWAPPGQAASASGAALQLVVEHDTVVGTGGAIAYFTGDTWPMKDTIKGIGGWFWSGKYPKVHHFTAAGNAVTTTPPANVWWIAAPTQPQLEHAKAVVEAAGASVTAVGWTPSSSGKWKAAAPQSAQSETAEMPPSFPDADLGAPLPPVGTRIDGNAVVPAGTMIAVLTKLGNLSGIYIWKGPGVEGWHEVHKYGTSGGVFDLSSYPYEIIVIDHVASDIVEHEAIIEDLFKQFFRIFDRKPLKIYDYSDLPFGTIVTWMGSAGGGMQQQYAVNLDENNGVNQWYRWDAVPAAFSAYPVSAAWLVAQGASLQFFGTGSTKDAKKILLEKASAEKPQEGAAIPEAAISEAAMLPAAAFFAGAVIANAAPVDNAPAGTFLVAADQHGEIAKSAKFVFYKVGAQWMKLQIKDCAVSPQAMSPGDGFASAMLVIFSSTALVFQASIFTDAVCAFLQRVAASSDLHNWDRSFLPVGSVIVVDEFNAAPFAFVKQQGSAEWWDTIKGADSYAGDAKTSEDPLLVSTKLVHFGSGKALPASDAVALLKKYEVPSAYDDGDDIVSPAMLEGTESEEEAESEEAEEKEPQIGDLIQSVEQADALPFGSVIGFGYGGYSYGTGYATGIATQDDPDGGWFVTPLDEVFPTSNLGLQISDPAKQWKLLVIGDGAFKTKTWLKTYYATGSPAAAAGAAIAGAFVKTVPGAKIPMSAGTVLPPVAGMPPAPDLSGPYALPGSPWGVDARWNQVSVTDVCALPIAPGTQKGGNPGGDVYVTVPSISQPLRFYVKTVKSPLHAINEVMAAQYYRALGILAPDLRWCLSGGKVKVISPWIDGYVKFLHYGSKASDSDFDAATRKFFAATFPVDVWLANWDVIGSADDNFLRHPGIPDVDIQCLRVDVGGSMAFRAMGQEKKGSEWSSDLQASWNTMTSSQHDSGKFFGSLLDSGETRQVIVETFTGLGQWMGDSQATTWRAALEKWLLEPASEMPDAAYFATQLRATLLARDAGALGLTLSKKWNLEIAGPKPAIPEVAASPAGGVWFPGSVIQLKMFKNAPIGTIAATDHWKSLGMVVVIAKTGSDGYIWMNEDGTAESGSWSKIGSDDATVPFRVMALNTGAQLDVKMLQLAQKMYEEDWEPLTQAGKKGAAIPKPPSPTAAPDFTPGAIIKTNAQLLAYPYESLFVGWYGGKAYIVARLDDGFLARTSHTGTFTELNNDAAGAILSAKTMHYWGAANDQSALKKQMNDLAESFNAAGGSFFSGALPGAGASAAVDPYDPWKPGNKYTAAQILGGPLVPFGVVLGYKGGAEEGGKWYVFTKESTSTWRGILAHGTDVAGWKSIEVFDAKTAIPETWVVIAKAATDPEMSVLQGLKLALDKWGIPGIAEAASGDGGGVWSLGYSWKPTPSTAGQIPVGVVAVRLNDKEELQHFKKGKGHGYFAKNSSDIIWISAPSHVAPVVASKAFSETPDDDDTFVVVAHTDDFSEATLIAIRDMVQSNGLMAFAGTPYAKPHGTAPTAASSEWSVGDMTTDLDLVKKPPPVGVVLALAEPINGKFAVVTKTGTGAWNIVDVAGYFNASLSAGGVFIDAKRKWKVAYVQKGPLLPDQLKDLKTSLDEGWQPAATATAAAAPSVATYAAPAQAPTAGIPTSSSGFKNLTKAPEVATSIGVWHWGTVPGDSEHRWLIVTGLKAPHQYAAAYAASRLYTLAKARVAYAALLTDGVAWRVPKGWELATSKAQLQDPDIAANLAIELPADVWLANRAVVSPKEGHFFCIAVSPDGDYMRVATIACFGNRWSGGKEVYDADPDAAIAMILSGPSAAAFSLARDDNGNWVPAVTTKAKFISSIPSAEIEKVFWEIKGTGVEIATVLQRAENLKASFSSAEAAAPQAAVAPLGPNGEMIAAGALVTDGSRILLTKRAAHLSSEPGKWGLPAGVVEAGETPADAAKRELKEELGHLPSGLVSTGTAFAVDYTAGEYTGVPDNGLIFHTVVFYLDPKDADAYKPFLGDAATPWSKETDGWAWVPVDELGEEEDVVVWRPSLHFGLAFTSILQQWAANREKWAAIGQKAAVGAGFGGGGLGGMTPGGGIQFLQTEMPRKPNRGARRTANGAATRRRHASEIASEVAGAIRAQAAIANPAGYTLSGVRTSTSGKTYIEYRPRLLDGSRPRIRVELDSGAVAAAQAAQELRESMKAKELDLEYPKKQKISPKKSLIGTGLATKSGDPIWAPKHLSRFLPAVIAVLGKMSPSRQDLEMAAILEFSGLPLHEVIPGVLAGAESGGSAGDAPGSGIPESGDGDGDGAGKEPRAARALTTDEEAEVEAAVEEIEEAQQALQEVAEAEIAQASPEAAAAIAAETEQALIAVEEAILAELPAEVAEVVAEIVEAAIPEATIPEAGIPEAAEATIPEALVIKKKPGIAKPGKMKPLGSGAAAKAAKLTEEQAQLVVNIATAYKKMTEILGVDPDPGSGAGALKPQKAMEIKAKIQAAIKQLHGGFGSDVKAAAAAATWLRYLAHARAAGMWTHLLEPGYRTVTRYFSDIGDAKSFAFNAHSSAAMLAMEAAGLLGSGTPIPKTEEEKRDIWRIWIKAQSGKSGTGFVLDGEPKIWGMPEIWLPISAAALKPPAGKVSGYKEWQLQDITKPRLPAPTWATLPWANVHGFPIQYEGWRFKEVSHWTAVYAAFGGAGGVQIRARTDHPGFVKIPGATLKGPHSSGYDGEYEVAFADLGKDYPVLCEVIVDDVTLTEAQIHAYALARPGYPPDYANTALGWTPAKGLRNPALQQDQEEPQGSQLQQIEQLAAEAARRNPGTTIQTLLFDRAHFTRNSAKAWAADHDFKHSEKLIDATASFVRIRQIDPRQIRAGTFRTIEITEGIRAVIGIPR